VEEFILPGKRGSTVSGARGGGNSFLFFSCMRGIQKGEEIAGSVLMGGG